MTKADIDYIILDLKEGKETSDIAKCLGFCTDEVEIVKKTMEYYNTILLAKDKMLADAHFELQELYKKIANKFFND